MAGMEGNREELVARHGYVPGDLGSMAEGLVRRVERDTGHTFALAPPRPVPEGEAADGAAALAREHYRLWKLDLGGWDIHVEYDGFNIYAFTDHRETREGASENQAAGFDGLVSFLTEAVHRADRDAKGPSPSSRGP